MLHERFTAGHVRLTISKRLDMPKGTSSVAPKTYRATTKAYDALAEIFQNCIRNETGPERLYQEAQAGHPVWDEVRSTPRTC